MVLYIPTEKYKFTVITKCDIISQKNYIIKRRKSIAYKVGKYWKMLTSYKKRDSREPVKRGGRLGMIYC